MPRRYRFAGYDWSFLDMLSLAAVIAVVALLALAVRYLGGDGGLMPYRRP